jgi:hypothetical protein
MIDLTSNFGRAVKQNLESEEYSVAVRIRASEIRGWE